MGEIRLSHCCRLCLKEGFSLTNIFSQRSAAGDPLYQILNFIYEMKIFENDGLPSQICSPCMWRMIEFDACKKNVRCAEAEIMRLLSQTRPDEPSEVEVALEQGPVNSEVSIKEQFDVVEWEMPAETAIKVPEAGQHFQEADKYDYNDVESDDYVEAVDLPEDEYEEKCTEKVFSQPSQEATRSSDLKKILSLEASEETVGNSFKGESSSICTSQYISYANSDTNKGMPENDLRSDVVPVGESLYTQISKSILNFTKSGRSIFKAPLYKRKNEFICDICKKSFHGKVSLGRHVRVHYDDRPFSCTICDKRFKQESVRNNHQLTHLRPKMSVGESEKGNKKMLYSCDLCAKNFSSKLRLWRHSNLHSNKYKCHSCGRYFGDNSVLTNHLRTHTIEKPFKCEVCFKCFNRKSILDNHLLIHSSERPFPCDICDKRFKSKRDKTRHELYHLRKNKIHTGYVCPFYCFC